MYPVLNHQNQKFAQYFIIVALLSLTLFALLPSSARAISDDQKRCDALRATLRATTTDGTIVNLADDLPNFCTINQAYKMVIDIVLGLAATVAVVFIIIGGSMYLTSAGNEERAEKGKKALLNAILGLVIIILSFAIVRVVNNLLTSDRGSPTPPPSSFIQHHFS